MPARSSRAALDRQSCIGKQRSRPPVPGRRPAPRPDGRRGASRRRRVAPRSRDRRQGRRRRRRAQARGSWSRTSGASAAMSPLRDIGRVGHDQIERAAATPAAKVAGDECAARAKPRRCGIARARRRAPPTLISVPMPVAFGSSRQQRQQQRARAGADDRAMRSFSVASASRTIAVERRFDHGFGFRPRHQHGRRRSASAGPRIPCAEDARDRLALEPALARSAAIASVSSRGRARARRCAISCGAVEAERMADQHARIELGRIRCRRCAKRLRPAPARAADDSPPCGRRCTRHVSALGREQRGLMLGHQRVDDLAERLAFHHLRQLVERQIDAVVGDAALRKIIGADALGAVAGADLAAPLGGARGVELAALGVVELGAQHRPSPWPCSCAASAPPARTPRCRSADG